MKTPMLSKRAWALAAAGALIAAAWLETAQNNPQIIGPFALTWLAETHPVSSWIALATAGQVMPSPSSPMPTVRVESSAGRRVLTT